MSSDALSMVVGMTPQHLCEGEAVHKAVHKVAGAC